MRSQTEIRLRQINISGSQDIDTLIQAAQDIQSVTDANFRHIQGKTWYKRFWEIVTFSKNNQKVMAKNVASLAKMQDIIVKALLMLSNDERKIAEYLANNAEQLKKIACLQPKLTRAIDKMIYEHDPRPNIQDMNEDHQFVIISAVWKFVDMSCQYVPSLVQEYLGNLKKCCVFSLNPEAEAFDCKKINALDSDGNKLLTIILCEAAVLLNDSPQKEKTFEEIRAYIDVGPLNFSKINDKVKTTAKLLGEEFIASHYAEIVIDNDVFLIDADGIEFEEETDTPRNAADINAKFITALEQYHNIVDDGEQDLEKMIKKANLAVATATAAAATIGASPIPFADLPILVTAQVTLLSTIAVIFQINTPKDGLKTLVYAALGVGGVALLGKAIFSALLKIIPGLGTILGGAIAASVAATMTYAMGKSFIEICKAVKLGELREKDIFSKGEEMFKTSFETLFKEKNKQEEVNREIL